LPPQVLALWAYTSAFPDSKKLLIQVLKNLVIISSQVKVLAQAQAAHVAVVGQAIVCAVVVALLPHQAA